MTFSLDQYAAPNEISQDPFVRGMTAFLPGIEQNPLPVESPCVIGVS
jgi:hypothetical protein